MKFLREIGELLLVPENQYVCVMDEKWNMCRLLIVNRTEQYSTGLLVEV